jgi:hypothetical protein
MAKTDRFPDRSDDFDLDTLLHPAQAFAHPMDVARDPDLTLNEKRAILASWASDACAVESIPALRRPPHGPTVSFDDVVDALRSLDRESRNAVRPPSALKRRLRAWRYGRREGEGNGGIGLQ